AKTALPTLSPSDMMTNPHPSNGDCGCTCDRSPCELAWCIDNSTLNGENIGDSPHRDKNDNIMTEATIRRLAFDFSAGLTIATTSMLMCPASPEYGTPRLWLKVFLTALAAFPSGEKAEAGNYFLKENA
ncbi:unnamed protein product, partial [Laminaria digitata]